MDHLPEEIVSHIMQYLDMPDRNEAALVCRNWYQASLHPRLQRDKAAQSQPSDTPGMPAVDLIRNKLMYLEFGEWDSHKISEDTFVSVLNNCPQLRHLNLSGCNSLFLSGRLLSKPWDVTVLSKVLTNVRVLELGRLRHMTDVTFERLVSTMENLEQVSLSSTNMIFGSSLYYVNQSSPVMLHFTALLKFTHERARKIKVIDLSNTAVNDEALGSLAQINDLALEEISLKGCLEISEKGLKMLISHQHSLKVLDVSGCSKLGSDALFFSTLANNLPQLHTLFMRKCTKISQSDVASLSGFGSLHSLDMGEVLRFYDKDLINGLCFNGPRLTSLAMPSCPDISDEFVIQLCKSSYNLISLDFSSCTKLTDASVQAITRGLTLLQSLRLSHCREISDMGILGLVPENGLVPRRSFDFDHDSCPCMRERDSKIFQKPLGLVKAHRHCTGNSHIHSQKREEMYMLSNLKSLRVLDLSYCPRITEVGLADAVRFSELSSLALNGVPRITDKAVVAIAQHNGALEVVELAGNPLISDAAVSELACSCTQLNSLDVSRCGALTDKCLKAIEAYCKEMRHLDVSGNNMTVPVVARLQSQLPQMRVVFKPHFE